MISISHFASAVREAVAAEKKTWEGLFPNHLFLLPPAALLQAIRKKLWLEREDIFNETVTEYLSEHPYKRNSESILFRAGSGGRDAEYLLLEMGMNLSHADFESLIHHYFEYSYRNCRAFYAMLLRGRPEDISSWQTLQDEHLLGQVQLSAGPLKLNGTANKPDTEQEQLWLLLWEIKLQEITFKEPGDMQKAMQQAVQNMKYENMLSVVRKIISLRTHIPEENIQEDHNLSYLFRLAFSMEQGVSVEEVYDPEAMTGYTDTQLACKNLLTDLQKIFCISFTQEEEPQIATLRDLTYAIVIKTA